MHYNHGVIWRRTDIFVKLNLPMQKQDVFLYLSKCWSSPHRESLENVVVRSFPKGVRPCFITAVEAMGVTPLQLPGVPLKCCKRTTETSSFHFIITITWLMQEGAMGGAPGLLKPQPYSEKPQEIHALSSLTAESLLLPTRLEGVRQKV